jgi:hypothetical protein
MASNAAACDVAIARPARPSSTPFRLNIPPPALLFSLFSHAVLNSIPILNNL